MGVGRFMHKSLDQSLRSRKETEAGARRFVNWVLSQLSRKLRHSSINHEKEKSLRNQFEMGGATHDFQSPFHCQRCLSRPCDLSPQFPYQGKLQKPWSSNGRSKTEMRGPELVQCSFVNNICTRCPLVTQCTLSPSFSHKMKMNHSKCSKHSSGERHLKQLKQRVNEFLFASQLDLNGRILPQEEITTLS